MRNFYVDTDEKLIRIFTDHCALSPEQYEELRAQFIYLICDYQEEEPTEEIAIRIRYLQNVIAFLYNTKALTLKENYELVELLEEIMLEAEKEGQS